MLTLLSRSTRSPFSSQLYCLLCHSQAAASRRHLLQRWQQRRGLLSAAFTCPDAWHSRLAADEFVGGGGAASGLDLGNGLSRALDKREPVAAVDIDVYANKLDSYELDYLPFFASVMAKFRATQESLAKLESTDHALVRCMISLGQAELLVDWLRDKFTYGIFLDQYSACLLIDHLLESGNARLAALASFDHCVQDLPTDGQLCNALMLLACASRAAELTPTWRHRESSSADAAEGKEAAAPNDEEDEEADDEQEDDEDTQHVIVDYIRLPNYDGHFDLDEERLQLGRTLACLASRLATAEQHAGQVAAECALVGLAALEKPDELLAATAAAVPVGRSAVELADALLATARLLPQAQENLPGRRPRCHPAAVQAAREALQKLPLAAEDSSVQGEWHDRAAALARRLVSEAESRESQSLADLYRQFEATRLAELRRHGDWLRRRQLFRGVKSQLDSLVEEQELLTAFDKAAEIRYAAWLAPRTRAEKRVTSRQIWARDTDNANRMLDEVAEAATRSGGGRGGPLPGRATTRRRDKFRPLQE